MQWVDIGNCWIVFKVQHNPVANYIHHRSSFELFGTPYYMCKTLLLYSPYKQCHHAIIDLFGSVDESDLLRCLDEMDPDGKKILEVLSPEYSLDDHLTTHEMRVFEQLQRYVSTLNVESSKVFLKYVTGMKILRNEIS